MCGGCRKKTFGECRINSGWGKNSDYQKRKEEKLRVLKARSHGASLLRS